ncbi:hypothetical protein HX052_17270 [Myroides marinus]|uniref:hypothetical protein n=1 Tax=Myroides marinus TaxID=703342 RepID=UPI0025786C0E|nr:hypothetical protein [Myroides marinus]MDM1391687.1 hypothetical protein [Myroides marinus]
MLYGTLAEAGLGSLVKHGEYKKVANQASNNTSVYEKKAVELSSRKSPNEKLIKNAKSFKKLDASDQAINKTI